MPLQEIALTVTNRPGALAEVARILAKERINLAALSVNSEGGTGLVRMIVNDPKRARTVLRAAKFKVATRDLLVVHLEDRTGSLLPVLEMLTEAKVNIDSVAILVMREGSRSLVALSTSDLKRARTVLAKAGLLSDSAEQLLTNADLLAAPAGIPPESVGLLF